MVWSKLTLKIDSATSTISLFSPSNARKFITHTPFPLERIGQELISPNPRVVSRLFKTRTMTQIWELMSFKVVSWLNHIELLH